MLRKLLFPLIIATSFGSCGSQQDTAKTTITDPITKVEMHLSAFGVEADDFPSIVAYIDFLHDSSRCEKTYDNPAFKPSTYILSGAEIKKVLQLLETVDLEKLKSEYSVAKTDQPTSTTTIYIGQKTVMVKDYGLAGDYPLKELYKIVYKY